MFQKQLKIQCILLTFKVTNVSSPFEVVAFLDKHGSAIFRTFHACKCYLLMQIKQYTILF